MSRRVVEFIKLDLGVKNVEKYAIKTQTLACSSNPRRASIVPSGEPILKKPLIGKNIRGFVYGSC